MRVWNNRKERGAVAVEMAIVVPVLVLLAFGMLEFGLAFKTKLTIAHAVNQATRNATVLGTDDYADIEILGALEDALGNYNMDNLVHVDIFLADSSGAPSAWNRYEHANDACGWDPCPDPVYQSPPDYGSPDDYWPCNRDIVLNADGVDTIGIQVEYQHYWVTGVLGIPSQTWHETARGRMEPDLFGTDNPVCP